MIIKFFYRSFWWKSWYIYFFHLINQKLTINNTHYCFIALSLIPLPCQTAFFLQEPDKRRNREKERDLLILPFYPHNWKTANTICFSSSSSCVAFKKKKKTRQDSIIVVAENKWSRLEGTLSASPVLAASARSPPPMR